MKSPSEVRTGIVALAQFISNQREALRKQQAQAVSSFGLLESASDQFAELIATIQSYEGNNAFENSTKEELALLMAEIDQIKAVAVAVKDLSF